jgi:hypothetical protein
MTLPTVLPPYGLKWTVVKVPKTLKGTDYEKILNYLLEMGKKFATLEKVNQLLRIPTYGSNW